MRRYYLRFQNSITPVIILFFLLSGLSACAGYHMGYFSMPYVGEKPPFCGASSSHATLFRMRKIQFEDFVLEVNLNNMVQTSHTAWAGPVPLRLDLETRSATIETSSDHYCVEISFIPKKKAIVFRPEHVILTINGHSFNVVNTLTSQYINGKREVSEINSDPIALVNLGKRYSYDFSLCFKTRKPTPDQLIKLDFSMAIQVSGQEKGQLIHFRKTRYRHGYT